MIMTTKGNTFHRSYVRAAAFFFSHNLHIDNDLLLLRVQTCQKLHFCDVFYYGSQQSTYICLLLNNLLFFIFQN